MGSQDHETEYRQTAQAESNNRTIHQLNHKAMFTKKTTPIIRNSNSSPSGIVGTITEYRFLGVLIYKKTLHSPEYYGVTENYTFYYKDI